MRKNKYILITVIIIAGFFFSFYFVQVARAFLLGPNYAGTAVDDATDGSFVWSNPGNATGAADGTLATVSSGNSTGSTHSDYLKATGFNFSIPKNATILGVIAEIDRQDGGQNQTPHDAHVYIVKGGSIQTSTTDQASTTLLWPASLTYASYGGVSDMWGNALTPSDINNAGFGVAINITGDVSGSFTKYAGDIDAIRMSVSYTTPGFRMMASAHYAVQSDSINFAGGISTSSSYTIQDAVGEVGTGISTSTNYKMSAGYEQMLQSYIAISPSGASTSTLASINGVTGGTSTASSTWTVTTDNPAGYSLSVQASQSPAMQGDHGDSLADYVPVSGAVPDFNFSILPSQSAFGFSPAGVDTASRYLNDGAACSAGIFSTLNYCWDGFSTSPKVIAQGLMSNAPSGATTTAVYQAQIGTARNQTSGSYSATITVTAVTL